MLQIACTIPELTHYDESSARQVLPITSLPRQYPPWQPLQQIREDLQNPFGRLLVGPKKLLLQPGEVELGPQLVFGTDGVLGTIEGVVTRDLRTIDGLLVTKLGRNCKAPVTLPIHLIEDWETMDIAVGGREFDIFDERG